MILLWSLCVCVCEHSWSIRKVTFQCAKILKAVGRILFYIHGSVHRDSILMRYNEMQQYAGIYLLRNYSTCFGCLSHPSSGVHQTVTAASGTGHITCQSNYLPPVWPNYSNTITCTRSCGYILRYS